LLGKNDLDLFPPEHAAHFMAKDREVLDGETDILDIPEEPIMTAKKGQRLLHTRKVCIRGADGTTKYLLGISEDITDRKEAEDQIKASLKEKEVLLKEIQHRVKNNLLTISGILALQSERIKDNESKDAFITSMNRINAMTKIHTRLYQSEDYALIHFKGYMEELLGELSRSYGFPHENLIIDIQDISLNINTAIPTGLIVNELVSNAMKHAFPNGNKGPITVTLSSENTHNILTVSDNGIGLPPHIDFRNTESVGFSLLGLLVEQINGTVKLLRDNGTQFIITFSID
jgi:two-component sensor histidine kinase